MKKLKYLFFSLLILFSFNMLTCANNVVVINGSNVRIRSMASTSSNVLATVNNGIEFDLVSMNVNSKGNGCAKDWIIINYEGKNGYVCSEFVIVKEVVPTEVVEEPKEEEPIEEPQYENYRDYLISKKFPDSYIPYLEEIHKARPSWDFTVMNIDVDFNTVISKEHTSDGRSLLEDTNRSRDGLKSLESWSYNFLTDVFNTDYEGGGSRWYAASKDTIAYYVDPRNFLNEKQIFMFESQYFNKDLHTKDGISKMLKGTFMDGKYADKEKTKTFVDAFYDGGIKYNVSPYMLVSRVIQEVGSGGSTIVSGTVKNYEGYYNFYNISAYGNSSSETITNGLKKAKAEGWNDQYKAVVGGAKFMVDGYLSQGQDTLYLNKWDFVGKDFYNHQYMQNIEAPSTESVKTYNAYKNINALDNAFMFSIPVFKNMPDKTSMPNKKNPNNYLSSLSVNGSYLFDEASNDTEFSLNLAMSTNSISIEASKVSSKSTIIGTGSVSLSSDIEIIPITVTAENGNIRTYNITITRTSEIPLAISEILNVSGIINDGTYISGIKLNSDISELVKKITDTEGKSEVSSYSINGNVKSSGIIASGDIIKIKTSINEKEFKIIIYGDINSDGKITSADYIKVRNHIMDSTKLNEMELIFADANKDGKVNSADYIAIKNHIMDSKKITQ